MMMMMLMIMMMMMVMMMMMMMMMAKGSYKDLIRPYKALSLPFFWRVYFQLQ